MLNKKKRRKILLDDKEYYWITSRNNEFISLVVSTEIPLTPKLEAKIKYYKDNNGDNKSYVVTPYIIKQVVEYALNNGWNPFAEGKNMDLFYVDDKIDLRFEKNLI